MRTASRVSLTPVGAFLLLSVLAAWPTVGLGDPDKHGLSMSETEGAGEAGGALHNKWASYAPTSLSIITPRHLDVVRVPSVYLIALVDDWGMEGGDSSVVEAHIMCGGKVVENVMTDENVIQASVPLTGYRNELCVRVFGRNFVAVAERCVDILLFEFDQNPAMLAVRNGSQCEEHIFSNLAIENLNGYAMKNPGSSIPVVARVYGYKLCLSCSVVVTIHEAVVDSACTIFTKVRRVVLSMPMIDISPLAEHYVDVFSIADRLSGSLCVCAGIYRHESLQSPLSWDCTLATSNVQRLHGAGVDETMRVLDDSVSDVSGWRRSTDALCGGDQEKSDFFESTGFSVVDGFGENSTFFQIFSSVMDAPHCQLHCAGNTACRSYTYFLDASLCVLRLDTVWRPTPNLLASSGFKYGTCHGVAQPSPLRLRNEYVRVPGAVTVVLNVFKRIGMFRRQLLALATQSLKPAAIWVCMFNTPVTLLQRYMDMLRGFADEHHFIRVRYFASSYNFKYHGRFQLAGMVDTEFLAMLDDDVIPRRDFLRFSVESLVAEAGPDGKFPGNAVLGTRGWIIPKKGSGRPMFSGIDWKQGDRVELGTEVDMLCSHWFTRTNSVAAMFIEEVLTLETAEDMQFAYALRRYSNVSFYVLPNRGVTGGIDWSEDGVAGTTQGTQMEPLRRAYVRHLRRRWSNFASGTTITESQVVSH